MSAQKTKTSNTTATANSGCLRRFVREYLKTRGLAGDWYVFFQTRDGVECCALRIGPDRARAIETGKMFRKLNKGEPNPTVIVASPNTGREAR